MKQEIIQIIKDLRPEFDFSQEVNFIEEGMLDSFDLVSLVTDLESKFGVVIDGMDIVPENFSSLDAIEALVNKSKK
jgi:acyl carrier protein